MNDYDPLGDFPDSITPFKVIRIGSADHLHHIVFGRAHAIDVANTMCVVGIIECQTQVRGQVVGLTPDRIQDLLNCFANARVPP